MPATTHAETKQAPKESAVARTRATARRRRRWLKRALIVAVVGVFAALAVLAFVPDPIAVDTTAVRRGPITVELVESGKTRLRNRYVVRAPIAGNMSRFDLWPGDAIEPAQVVARLTAIAPPLLSAQERRGALARRTAARAALDAAKAESKRAQLGGEKLAADVAKLKELVARGASPQARLTDAEHAHRDAMQLASTSAFRVSVARGELRVAEAVLSVRRADAPATGAIELRAPIGGTILRVLRRDAGPVATGEPLFEVGDMSSLEIIIDVLTADAVTVSAGALVKLRGGRGMEHASARVTRIEPAGFTRLSALGVEEQRVNVIARFEAAPPSGLGDEFGIEAEIVVREKQDALILAIGSLFRSGSGWAAFKVVDGKAVLTDVEIGLRSDFEAEVVSGLAVGDRVVLHPSDRVLDGSRIERR